MIKVLLIISTLLTLRLEAFTGGANGVGGSGIAEKHITYALSNLASYLSMCISSQMCNLEGEEKSLLIAIKKSLVSEMAVKDLIVFKSEKEDPGFFIIEGRPKIAKTGFSIGSPIYFNTDLLYKKDSQGTTVPLSLPSAIGILVHELGHHQGEIDHLKLDLLGSKVEKMVALHIQVIDAELKNISVTAIDLNGPETFTQVLVSDAVSMIDVSSEIAKKIECPSLPDSGNPVVGARLWNLHLNGGLKTTLGFYEMEFRGRVEPWCKKANGIVKSPERYDFSLVVGVSSKEESPGNFTFVLTPENKFRFLLITCAFLPGVCH